MSWNDRFSKALSHLIVVAFGIYIIVSAPEGAISVWIIVALSLMISMHLIWGVDDCIKLADDEEPDNSNSH